jgi:hypothetical protein
MNKIECHCGMFLMESCPSHGDAFKRYRDSNYEASLKETIERSLSERREVWLEKVHRVFGSPHRTIRQSNLRLISGGLDNKEDRS